MQQVCTWQAPQRGVRCLRREDLLHAHQTVPVLHTVALKPLPSIEQVPAGSTQAPSQIEVALHWWTHLTFGEQSTAKYA